MRPSPISAAPCTGRARSTACTLDPDLALPWPQDLIQRVPLLSPKDAAAPSLQAALAAGALPTVEACRARYATLRDEALRDQALRETERPGGSG